MRVVIIGGTGHVGTYLVPRLVEAGHEVINVSRDLRAPYQPDLAWRRVRQVTADREAGDRSGSFGARIRELAADVVIDLICFTLDSARQLVDVLAGTVQHHLHCGTIAVHGKTAFVPTTEEHPRRPSGEYAIAKAEIEDYLRDQARRHHYPATVLNPAHIVGPGWVPVNPVGNLDPQLFTSLAAGEPVVLPNLGLETLHLVHADDVAQAFVCAVSHREVTLGESFHVAAPEAMTLNGYAESVAAWHGREARLSYLPWEQWRGTVASEHAADTWDHLWHTPCCSIEKAKRLIGYQPRYSAGAAAREAVTALLASEPAG